MTISDVKEIFTMQLKYHGKWSDLGEKTKNENALSSVQGIS